MAIRAPRRFVTVALASLVVAACSQASDDASPTTETQQSEDDDEPTVSDDAPLTPATEATTPDRAETTTTTTTSVPDGPLADVCPETLSIQTAELPSVPLGPLYEMLGTDPAIDAERGAVSAPLTRPDGTVEDVTLEIRAGGPPVGFRNSVDLLIEDPTLSIAHAALPTLLTRSASGSATAVASLTARSHDAVVVDPVTHPDVDSWESLRGSDVEIRHLTGAAVVDFLAATGAVSSDRLVDGFDGEPAAFVESDGLIAQQGDLLVEPLLYPTLPQWNRPVTALAASDAGWHSLDDLLVVGGQRLSIDCLGRLVPIVQEAIVAYLDDPTPTNAVMTVARATINPLSRATVELLDAGARRAVELGVFESEPADGVIGGFDDERVAAFVSELADVLEVDPPTLDELIDERFLSR